MKLRLSDYEIKSIKETAKKYFGDDWRVLIFGLRASSEKIGGDVDTIVEDNLTIKGIAINGIKFLAELDFKVDELKIGLIVLKYCEMLKIFINQKSGVRLC